MVYFDIKLFLTLMYRLILIITLDFRNSNLTKQKIASIAIERLELLKIICLPLG